jgi:hypothetical protein
MEALRRALELLKEHAAAVEDPGDEIGPEGEGSPNMGLGHGKLYETETNSARLASGRYALTICNGS